MVAAAAVDSEKAKMRDRLKARRAALDEPTARTGARQVCEHLTESELFEGVDRVAGYMARGRELNVHAFLDQLLESGVEVLLPRVVGAGQMEFCAIDDWDQLRPGSFGIDEPTTPPVDHNDTPVFLVPGLGFDEEGTRLGFGMGYYDRALPPVGQALAVGVGYRWQLLDKPLPRQPHDRPMDVLVTPDGWYRVDGPGNSLLE